MSANLHAAANDDPAALLAQAREAWRMKREAESQIARLNRYTRKNRAMRDDLCQHSSRLTDANTILQRVLGAAA